LPLRSGELWEGEAGLQLGHHRTGSRALPSTGSPARATNLSCPPEIPSAIACNNSKPSISARHGATDFENTNSHSSRDFVRRLMMITNTQSAPLTIKARTAMSRPKINPLLRGAKQPTAVNTQASIPLVMMLLPSRARLRTSNLISITSNAIPAIATAQIAAKSRITNVIQIIASVTVRVESGGVISWPPEFPVFALSLSTVRLYLFPL
jgi:hypothetical protein